MLSSEEILTKLTEVQNNAPRIITGTAKSTTIPASELQTGTLPLQLRREKSMPKIWERNHRVNNEFWESYSVATGS